MAHIRPAVLVFAVATCLALPAVAQGQAGNDNYANAFPINSSGSVLPATSTRTGTIVNGSVEAGEITGCVPRDNGPQVNFGDTAWWTFYPHRPGFVRVAARATTFRAVVAVMPFSATTGLPDINSYRCITETLGTATLDYEFKVQEGAGYRIQVGAVTDPTTTEGEYTLSLYFNPDTDRDGLVDSLDICPSLVGGVALGGCPDADGDLKIDPGDACPRESSRGKRDRNDNGCPDREFLRPETKLTPGLFCTDGNCHGVKVKKLVVSEIPRGTRVTVSCTKRACRKASKKAGKTRRVRFFSGKNLKAGVGLEITLSRSGYVSRRITYWIKPNDWKKTTSCLKSGKAVRCTQSLLVR